MVEYGGLEWKRSQSSPLSQTKLVIAQKTWYGTMGDMVLCVGGEEADSFFMGGRECEDGEGERGRGGKLVFGDGYCFQWGIEWTAFCPICGLSFLLSHFFLHVG